ncbi:MAG TPA: gliding motility-associated C-terminal domain-containing protein [Sphingobacteriaceae bacterium]
MKKAVFPILLLLDFSYGFSQMAAPAGNDAQTVTIKAGTTITLTAHALYADNFQWYRNGKAIPGARRLNFIAGEAGEYSVAASSSDCTSILSDAVRIIVLPGSAFSADLQIEKSSETRTVSVGEIFEYTLKARNNGADNATRLTVTDVLPQKVRFVEFVSPVIGKAVYNTAATTVIWTIDQLAMGREAELKIRTRALTGGNIKNTASIAAFEGDPNLNNNTSEDVKEITGIKVPNVFSPNGDGLNDRFRIPGLESYSENEFTVINRWGSHVFEKKQYHDEWTGDRLNEGTYFYVLKLKRLNGQWQVLKGYITLLRSK